MKLNIISAIATAIVLCILRLASVSAQSAIQAADYHESAFLHTDRDVYLNGDQVIFSATVVESALHRPSSLSSVLYVELLTPGNTVLGRTIIALKDGQGSGILQLPQNAVNGYYALRAYTRWMQNAPASSYFHKRITILNPETNVVIQAPVSPKDISIDYFPEGGTLLEGIETRMAFQVKDAYGCGFATKGWLISDVGDTLTRLSTNNSGLGGFVFPALKNQKPFVVLEDSSGTRRRFAFPEPEPVGTALSVEFSESGLSISVYSSSPVSGSEKLLLMAGNVVLAQRVLQSGQNLQQLIIPLDECRSGLNSVILNDKDGNTLNTRYVFVHKPTGLNIHLDSPKRGYSNREKVVLTVQSSDASGLPLASVLSVSVSLAPANLPQEPDMASYLSLGAQSGCQTFELADTSFHELFDHYLLTLSQSIPDKAGGTLLLPEWSGKIVEGRLTDKKSMLPVPNQLVFLSLIGANCQLRTATTGSDGIFRFIVGEQLGEQLVMISLPNDSVNALIQVKEDFSDQYANLGVPLFYVSPENRNYIEQLMLCRQVNEAWGSPFSPRNVRPVVTDFFGASDFLIETKDFIKLPNMEEVFRELVKPTYLSRRNGIWQIEVIDGYLNRTLGDSAAFFIDGVPTFDDNTVISLEPSLVREIAVRSSGYFLDHQKFDGIIKLTTKNADLDGLELKGSKLRLKYAFPQPVPIIPQPDYSTPSEVSVPDFRPVLFWTPSIQTQADGTATIEFYTGDLDAQYNILIQGVTSDGQVAVYKGLLTVN